MAVRIPIVTVFDSKGIKQAQYQLNKVRGNFQNLGRNFAVAGAALAGAVTLIGKSLRDAADSQRVFAQTEAVLKSTGTTANGTAKEIQNLASSLQKSTAFNDEAILAGQNLLLTFKSVQNQAGEGNDIFNQASQTMLDFARATNTDASSAAIKLGKALQDPVRGVTALRKSGVDFTTDQQEMIKSLVQTGDLMGAQKIVLAELQAQFGGSAAAYAQTFAGQVESLNNELNDLSEEIGFMVMPAVRDMVAGFRELAPEIGITLKNAVASVDWKSFTTGIVNGITFLVQNADTIMRVVTAMFLLNTAYNVGRVAVGLYQAATLILKTTMEATTTSAKFLRTALFLGGVTLAVGSVIDEYRRLKTAIQESSYELSRFNTETIAVSGAAARLNPIVTIWQKITGAILGAVTAQTRFNSGSGAKGGPVPQGPRGADAAERWATGQSWSSGTTGTDFISNIMGGGSSGGGGGGGGRQRQPSFQQQLNKQVKIARKTGKLVSSGLSEGLAQAITSSNKPIKAANKILKRIAKNGQKAVNRLQGQFNQTAAGQAELAGIQAAADAAAQEAEFAALQAQQEIDREQDELQRAQEERLREEAAALAERERIYKSFADSVANTFSNIKEQILGAFSLPELGGSTNAIIRNMDKLLTRVKAFSSNITKLSSMGLDPKLLQQVINAGPIAGAKLAANLVAGGVGGLNAINAGYNELAGVAGEIGMTGTQAMFGTQAQQTIYNVNVEGGLDSPASIGKAVVDAIKAYERTSGAVWVGA